MTKLSEVIYHAPCAYCRVVWRVSSICFFVAALARGHMRRLVICAFLRNQVLS